MMQETVMKIRFFASCKCLLLVIRVVHTILRITIPSFLILMLMNRIFLFINGLIDLIKK